MCITSKLINMYAVVLTSYFIMQKEEQCYTIFIATHLLADVFFLSSFQINARPLPRKAIFFFPRWKITNLSPHSTYSTSHTKRELLLLAFQSPFYCLLQSAF